MQMWRALSSRASRDVDIGKLRKHLTRLYKKIHPDLLHQHPKERAVNETSFQTLQQVLREYEARDGASPQQVRGRIPETTLQFYYRPEETNPSHGSTASKQLEHVAVQLQHRELGLALLTLYETIGIDPPPPYLLPGSASSPFGPTDGSGLGGGQAQSLRDLVRYARATEMAAMQKRNEESGRVAQQHAASWGPRGSSTASPQDSETGGRDPSIARLALQRAHGVSVAFEASVPRPRGEELAIDRLSSLLSAGHEPQKRTTPRLSGLRLLINSGFQVDLLSSSGTLRLGICAGVEQWRRALDSAPAQAAAHRRRAIAQQERELARSIGIALLFHEDRWEEEMGTHFDAGTSGTGNEASNDEGGWSSYAELLDGLESAASESGAISGVDELSVMVTSGTQTAVKRKASARRTSDGSDGHENGVVDGWDDEEGVLRLSPVKGPDAALRAIATVGRQVAQRHARIKSAREAESARMWRVARALRVDEVRRGEGISDEQWNGAIDNLVRNAGKVGGILDRTNLVVGTSAQVLETGEVQIPWNFLEVMEL